MEKTWQCTNMLCIRLDNMGDVLMTTPAFRALKNSHAKLTLLTSSAGAAIAHCIPEIDAVIAYDVPWVKNHAYAKSTQVQVLIKKLQQKRFDAAIIFTTFGQNPLPTALMTYLANIPKRLSYCRENPYALLTNWIPDIDEPSAMRHEVIRQLDMVQSVGFTTDNLKLSLTLPLGAQQKAQEILSSYNITNKRWLLVHPGASELKRQYPPEQLQEALMTLQSKGYHIVLTGNAEEKAVAETLQKSLGKNVYSLAGKLDLETFAGLVSLAPLLISNNTGPVHIAAALGTPVLDLYAKTNPQHTPWQVKQKVLYFDVPKQLQTKNKLLQSFSFKGLEATPKTIVQSALELLQ